MRQLVGLFWGALIGLWAGPIGFIAPVVVIARGQPNRWAVLVGYLVGLIGAMLMYQVLDDIIFGRPIEIFTADPTPPEPATVNEINEIKVIPHLGEDTSAEPLMPIWLMAAIPGALIALMGAVGAGWILTGSSPENDANRVSGSH